MKNKYASLILLLTLSLIHCQSYLFGQTASTTISPSIIINTDSKRLLGITMDSRCGMNGNTGPYGYFNSNGSLIPNLDTIFDDFPLSGIRYPGQAITFGFDWKKSIGTTPRAFQNLLGSFGPSQSMDFGFDEFMAMCESRGLTGENIQIMVTIYDSAVTYYTNGTLNTAQNLARIPYPASSAADWVEYANAPDTANWGGGIAWGAIRSANGHPAPYNIKTWNIGNEPWGPSEMNFDTSQYFPIAKPVIDSMLARDPTIHITLPTTGNANSAWNVMIRNYVRSHSGIYGISPHFFSNRQTVDNIESALKTIVDSANAVNLKTVAGDFGHEILTQNSNAAKNRAMSWEGVNFSIDMLLMFAQINTIERANHWIFGTPYSVWRPIRLETNGTYTMLPVGYMYKLLEPYFLQNSIQSISTSPVASDMHPYSLRASGFSNINNDTITLIALNRDTLNTLTYTVNGLTGYQPDNSVLLTSDSLRGEIIYSANVTPVSINTFNLPPMSVLLLKYVTATTGLSVLKPNSEIKIYPNPSGSLINISLNKTDVYNLNIYDSSDKLVLSKTNLSGPLISIDTKLKSGNYFIKITNSDTSFSETKKLIIQ